jgi:hypothetical protein
MISLIRKNRFPSLASYRVPSSGYFDSYMVKHEITILKFHLRPKFNDTVGRKIEERGGVEGVLRQEHEDLLPPCRHVPASHRYKGFLSEKVRKLAHIVR